MSHGGGEGALGGRRRRLANPGGGAFARACRALAPGWGLPRMSEYDIPAFQPFGRPLLFIAADPGAGCAEVLVGGVAAQPGILGSGTGDSLALAGLLNRGGAPALCILLLGPAETDLFRGDALSTTAMRDARGSEVREGRSAGRRKFAASPNKGSSSSMLPVGDMERLRAVVGCAVVGFAVVRVTTGVAVKYRRISREASLGTDMALIREAVYGDGSCAPARGREERRDHTHEMVFDTGVGA